MRFSTNMMHRHRIQMMNSQNYKSYVKKKTTNKENNSERISLGDKIYLEKKDNQLQIVKKVSDSETKVLSTCDLDSAKGKQLSDYMFKSQTNPMTMSLSNINRQIKAMSLTNYL